MATAPWITPQKTMVALEGARPRSAASVFWGVVQGAVAIAVLLLGGAGTLEAMAVLTGGPFAVLSVVALVGLSVTLYRDEKGHRSLLDVIRARLPEIRTHHDIDPPEED